MLFRSCYFFGALFVAVYAAAFIVCWGKELDEELERLWDENF